MCPNSCGKQLLGPWVCMVPQHCGDATDTVLYLIVVLSVPWHLERYYLLDVPRDIVFRACRDEGYTPAWKQISVQMHTQQSSRF